MMTHQRLLHNIAALTSVHVVGYLVPLITLPYITRVLGIESWGELSFAQVILGYFGLFTDWGFSLSATRKVASLRDDCYLLSKVFFSIWAAQWLLAAISIAFLLALVAYVPFFSGNASYYLYGVGTIAGGVLFPIWFLNGLERMKQAALIQISARFAAVPLIFLFIRTPADAPLIIAINAASGFVAGVLTVFWVIRKLGLVWTIPTLGQVVSELTEGGMIFLSTLWISLYTTATPTILGVIGGPVAVGYFALADKIRNFAQSALGPILQAMFPRLSYLFASDIPKARDLLKRSAAIVVLISASESLALWFLAEYIVFLLAGEQFIKTIVVLKWLSPLPFVISLSNIFGIQIMLPNHLTPAFNRILGIAGALSLCMIAPLIHWRGAEGASINTLITESFVTVAMAFYLWKTKFFAAIRTGIHHDI